MEDSVKDKPYFTAENRIKRRSFTGDFKAFILSEWLTGRRSLNELAQEYDINPNQIKNWKSLLLKRAPMALADKRVGREMKAKGKNEKTPASIAMTSLHQMNQERGQWH
ncbi:MAG: transposase [Deltaproteobacteria bacterium]|nr:transposase [Deltaproteobacteria bacterium]